MGPLTRELALPSHPMLRPGFRVVRRDEGHVQVGLDPPHRAILPDVDDVREMIAALRNGVVPSPRTSVGHRALAALVDADLVVEHDLSRLGSAQFGRSYAARRDQRSRGSLTVTAKPGCEGWAEELRELSRSAGLTAANAGAPADLTIMLGIGETPREELDDLMRQDATLMPLISRVQGVEIGPLIAPGSTACHRCVDAHRGEQDPRRGLVLEQISQQVEGLRDEPTDPVLLSWGSAWAVRDAARYLEGDEPSTWSTSYVVGPSGPPQVHSWTRHPHCGCSWAADLDLSTG